MFHLLKAEIFRMKKKKLLYFSFLAVVVMAVFYMKFTEFVGVDELVKKSLSFGTILLPVIFIPFYLCIWQEDISTRFVNNILISGVSRIPYYITKLAVTYLTGAIVVTGYSLTVFLTALLTEGRFSIGEMASVAGIQLFLYLAVLTFGLMVYILVDSVALSTAVYVLFVLLFENLINSFLIQMDAAFQKVSQYFLFQNLSKVVDIFQMSGAEKNSILTGGIAVWAVAFAISILILQKKEYK